MTNQQKQRLHELLSKLDCHLETTHNDLATSSNKTALAELKKAIGTHQDLIALTRSIK